MKFLFSVHLYPPYHNAGGEMYLHNIAKFLISRGHQVRVLLHEAEHYGIKRGYIIDGVEVFPRGRGLEWHFVWADRVFTHLGFTSWTVPIAQTFRKPVFFVVHNTWYYPCVDVPGKQVGIVYNCQAAKDSLKYNQPNIVMPPPVDYRKYESDHDPIDNPYITLINLNENKGGKILYDIARAMPDRMFLAVEGAYDPQIKEQLPNVHIMGHTTDIMQVYRQTRILLMPSEYESWGMTATEAMSSGIPVICTPTFGLKENCGDAAVYVGKEPIIRPGNEKDKQAPKVTGRDDIGAWVREIKKLDKKKNYLSLSKLSRERARFHDPLNRYELLLDFVTNPNDPKYLS